MADKLMTSVLSCLPNTTYDLPAFNLLLAAGTSTDGFVINGELAGDYSGRSVSSAGDVNGDGLDDLIVGATHADLNGKKDVGKSYVVFGFAKYNIRFTCI
jgi:hypothetical protein